MVKQKTFEDSVDLDNRLAIDFKANPRWPHSHLCWEAKGPVAERYTLLESKIEKALSQSIKQTDRGIKFSLVMVGKKAKRAQPLILFTSIDAQARKDAKATIEKSGLVTRTEFKLGDLRHPPSGPIKEVAKEDEQTPQPHSFGEQSEVLFEPSDRIRLVGMPIQIRHGTALIRRATANAVYNGEHFGYVTAAHAFDECATEDEGMDEDDQEIDINFDDGNSDEELSDDGEVDVGEERDMLSLHSDTSPEESVSKQSSESPDTTLSRVSSLETNQSWAHPTMSAPNEASRQSDSLIDETQGTDQKPIFPPPRTLGRMLFPVKALDFAIIIVTDTEVISALGKLRDVTNDTEFTTGAAGTMNRSMVAWSSRGPIYGKLLESSLTMRLTSNGPYQHLYKFKYQYSQADTHF
jgi:hypothetical protein